MWAAPALIAVMILIRGLVLRGFFHVRLLLLLLSSWPQQSGASGPSVTECNRRAGARLREFVSYARTENRRVLRGPGSPDPTGSHVTHDFAATS
jgi:hypothetical protein